MTHQDRVAEARKLLTAKFGTVWQAAYAVGPDLGYTAGRLLAAMDQQPVTDHIVAIFVQRETGINLQADLSATKVAA